MVAKKFQNPTGGLNAAGRAYFNRKDGSKLKAPVTGKAPKGSKAAGRRASFCARMSGVCLLYTSPSPRDVEESRMPSSA